MGRDPEGGLEVQADLYHDASGAAIVFRNGEEIQGSWHRSDLGSPTQFVDSAGQVIPLEPGSTWVELVPNRSSPRRRRSRRTGELPATTATTT